MNNCGYTDGVSIRNKPYVKSDSPNLSALNGYLEQHVDGFKQLQRFEKFPDGQSNPTYHLIAASGSYVIRMQPAGELLKSAHAVDREYRVMSALAQSDVPVPEVLHLCLDRNVLGRLFYVMRYCSGKVYWNPQLPELDATHRLALYEEMNRVLAALHDVDVDAVGLQGFGKPGNYYERQIGRWTQQYQASQTQSINAMDELMKWLPDNVPVDDGQFSLIHGDYRIDNIMFSTTSTHAVALLDWELSTLGHPFADLAYQCMQWRLATDAVVPGLAGVDRAALGLPSESDYVQQYCDRRGLQGITHWPFYLAFSFFRFAAIVQGVKKRALEGNASSPKAMAYGELTPVLSKLGVQVLESH